MKTILRTIVTSLLCAALTLGSQAQIKERAQFSVGYVYQDVESRFDAGSFGLNGGRADVLIPLVHHVGVVAEFSGGRAGTFLERVPG